MKGTKREIVRVLFFLLIICTLTSCFEQTNYAPVSYTTSRSIASSAQRYRVKEGDTLFSIAFKYDLEQEKLADHNYLSKPYILQLGQLLVLPPPSDKGQAGVKVQVTKSKTVTTQTITNKKSNKQKKQTKVNKRKSNSRWRQPTKGNVVDYFSLVRANKGINIQGRPGQVIMASKSGRVAYSGNGLRGYGNLIIIKHSQAYLSAYAYNKKNLVKEGVWVKAGQKIATMGIRGKNKALLHFEIRKHGKPVNPLKYIHIR